MTTLVPAGRRASVAALALLAALPLLAQAPPPEDLASRLQRLEARVESLARENEALRAEVESLKSELKAPLEILPMELVRQKDAAAAAPPAEPQELATELVQNQPAPAARTLLNPDISAVGTFVGQAGDANPFDERPSALLEETELGFQAFVDPYAQAKLYVAITPEGAEMEEGYVSFITLPHDFTAKVGKLKAAFGKVNLMHTHVRPWIDHPLVIRNFFGAEGLNDSGISVSRLFANPTRTFVEGTAEVFRGEVEGVFEPSSRNDLFYLGHLRAYRDLTERSNLEIGGTWARGTAPDEGSNRLAGLDVTYRYKPLERSIYRSFIARAELVSNDRGRNSDRALGFYASADYQLARRWFAGVRVDRADRPDDPSLDDRGGSLTLTFWPSEFSQLRVQGRRTRYGGGPTIDELLLQLQFSIGAHGAHTF